MSHSNSNTRHTPSPSPSSPSLTSSTSKLPKFLQPKSTRDRSRSVTVTDPGPVGGASPTGSSIASSSNSASPEPYYYQQQQAGMATPAKTRKTSKFLGISGRDREERDREKGRRASGSMPEQGGPDTSMGVDEPPVIVEPPPPSPSPSVQIPIPRPRTRSERPASSAPTLYASTSASGAMATGGSNLNSTSPLTQTRGIGDILPTRLSGWFHHITSASSTDLSLPSLLAQHHSSSQSSPYSSSSNNSGNNNAAASPSRPKTPSFALLTAARHGKGHLDKAMRYLLDSDAVPDRCAEPIWLLGVRHPGWEGGGVQAGGGGSSVQGQAGVIRGGGASASPSPSSFRSSTSSIVSNVPTADPSLSKSHSSKHTKEKDKDKDKDKDPSAHWPPAFYIDFTSRVWLTYRSHFVNPIRDQRLGDLARPVPACGPPPPPPAGADADAGVDVYLYASTGHSPAGGAAAASAPSPSTTGFRSRPWNWVGGGEKTWSSDSGWGCMLRTGQSLLANALVCVYLGRDWRRPPHPVQTADYATYVQILTWFLDTPAPEAPFSVHRMALAGKELGTDVGQWFGPSVAAGAIRTLVSAFPDCGLAVSVATDGTLYQTQVFAASHGDTSKSPRRRHTTTWGERPVLLLLGIRLGIEGVNPIYYDTIKLLYTFPQSVGIAGGRPSSSYYFVGSQADNLFYLDPHNPRPAIPLRPPPPPLTSTDTAQMQAPDRQPTPDSDNSNSNSHSHNSHAKYVKRSSTPSSITQQQRTPAAAMPPSPSSVRTGSSNFSYHAPVSPSPLQHQFSNASSVDSETSASNTSTSYSYTDSYAGHERERSPPPSYQQHSQHGRWRSASASQPGSPSMVHSTSSSDHHQYQQHQRSFAAGGGMASRSNSTSTSTGTGDVGGAENGRGLDRMQQHYCLAYSAAELKTFHCERVRKMPMSGLDPSMLIGFLCRDEADWWDFKKRVADLPRTIFSLQDEPPTWPSDSDDNMGLESISEPDDMDMDEEEEEGVEVDGESEQFFDTYSGGSSASDRNHVSRRRKRGKSEEIDTEEDPVDPVTPGPNSRFDIIERPAARTRRKAAGAGAGGDEMADDDDEIVFRPDAGDEFGEEEVEEEGEEVDAAEAEGEGDDIEDDWIDPSLPTPTPTGPAGPYPPHVPAKEPSPSPPSSSNVPPLAKGKSSSLASASASGAKASSKTKKTKKQIPVPVPSVRLPHQQQEHYPFPMTPADDPALSSSSSSPPHERSRNPSTKGKRMHTARARDGGRTQSGGVKGILTD